MSNTCVFIITRGERKGEPCGANAKYDILGEMYCAPHADRIQQRAKRKENSIRIMNEIQGPAVTELPGEKINTSVFYFVINSNKTPEKLGPAGVKKFIAFTNMFNREDVNFSYLFSTNHTEVDRSKIMSFRSHADVEVGESHGALHANITVEYVHKTWLRYDLDKLRKDIKSYLGYNCKVFISVPQNRAPSGDPFVKYSNKNQLRQLQSAKLQSISEDTHVQSQEK